MEIVFRQTNKSFRMIDKTFCLRTFYIVARDMVDVIIKYIILSKSVKNVIQLNYTRFDRQKTNSC